VNLGPIATNIVLVEYFKEYFRKLKLGVVIGSIYFNTPKTASADADETSIFNDNAFHILHWHPKAHPASNTRRTSLFGCVSIAFRHGINSPYQGEAPITS
jgi:hypothetical protein